MSQCSPVARCTEPTIYSGVCMLRGRFKQCMTKVVNTSTDVLTSGMFVHVVLTPALYVSL
jgi:hypothetical protein